MCKRKYKIQDSINQVLIHYTRIKDTFLYQIENAFWADLIWISLKWKLHLHSSLCSTSCAATPAALIVDREQHGRHHWLGIVWLMEGSSPGSSLVNWCAVQYLAAENRYCQKYNRVREYTFELALLAPWLVSRIMETGFSILAGEIKILHCSQLCSLIIKFCHCFVLFG